MTITIDIPAVQALANAINNLASKGTLCVPTVSSEMADYYNQKADERLAALEPTEAEPPNPPDAEAITPPKRTRRSKAEMEAERKAIEEQKGRRVESHPSLGAPYEAQNVVTDQPEPVSPTGESYYIHHESDCAFIDKAGSAGDGLTIEVGAVIERSQEEFEQRCREMGMKGPFYTVSLAAPPEPAPFQWTLEQLKDTFIAPITDNDLRNELIAIRQEVDPQAASLAKVDPQHYPELAKRFTAWFNDKGLKLQLPEGAE